MKKTLFFLFFISISISTFSSNQLISELKTRIFEISKNPFFKTEELHELASAISNKGNTTDLNLRELYWNTFQDDSELDSILTTQQIDGSWSTINYNDSALSNWQPTIHISNLLFLARAYISPNSKFYHKKKVSTVLHRGIDYWFQLKPVCKNWWYNQIAIPRFMGLVFLFIENELTPFEKSEAIKVLDKSGFRMTGQNKVWLAGNVLLKAILTNDETLANVARDTIASEIYITQKEGIQPDYSFHQHGPQQQFGNYGLAYISSMAYYANVFGGTKLEFSDLQMDILRNYVFEGENWVVWRGFMDVSACNRQLFPQAQVGKALTLCVIANQLMTADSTNANLYSKLITRNLHPGILPEIKESKHFWSSDLSVFRSSNHYISIRSCSPRVKGTEFTNNENKKGHFISDGCTIFMRRGNEYEDIFPIWNWNFIPGVTAPILENTNPHLKTDDYLNPNAFVGGLINNSNGISTFHLQRNGIDAKKSWFYINGILICLGTDIKSTNGRKIITDVNQVFRNGNAIIKYCNGNTISVFKSDTTIASIESVWHDSIGYYFPKKQQTELSVKNQSGNWHDIADPYSSENVNGTVFNLWLNHGINAVKNSSYEYFVVPSVSNSEFNSIIKNLPFTVVKNNGSLQAVKLNDNTLFQVVFYKPTQFQTFSTNDYLKSENPGLIMLEQNNFSELTITVVDPTQKLTYFNLNISGKYCGNSAIYNEKLKETKIKIKLPTNENAGKSITLILKRLQNS